MADFLIDTNIFVDHLRGSQTTTDWLASLSAPPAVSVITVAELYAGARSQRQEAILQRLIGPMRQIPADAGIRRRAGAFVRLYGDGHGVDLADALIAATAEAENLVLATRNEKHFPMLTSVHRPY